MSAGCAWKIMDRPTGAERCCAADSLEPAVLKLRTGPARAAQSEARRNLRVLMLGPGVEVMGGISSVERLTLAALPPEVSVLHIPTMLDGGKAAKLWTFVSALCHFAAQLARQPDLVHIHFASRASSVRKELLARLALARGVKVIMHAHGAEYRQYWLEMSPRQRARTLQVVCRVDALIVLGEAWREFFRSIGVPAQKIVVLRNPVRLPRELPLRRETEVITCVFLGAIDHRKGAFDLVSAVAALPERVRRRLKMVIAGNGQVQELRDSIRSRDLDACMEVRGWLDAAQRDALLASAHVFVLPSHNEGLPMALLEAMAWGLAPVCTPVGSIAEVVEHETNGLLVTPGDAGALANALERLIEHPGERLRIAERARATVEPLSVEKYVTRLTELYRSVARSGMPDAL